MKLDHCGIKLFKTVVICKRNSEPSQKTHGLKHNIQFKIKDFWIVPGIYQMEYDLDLL